MATPTEDLASFNGLDAEEEDLNMQLADSEDHEEILKQEIAKSATKANFTHRRSLSTQGTAVGGTSLVIDTNVNVVQQRRIAGTPLKHSVYTTTSTITGSPSKTSSSSSMTPNSANALGVFGRYLGKKRESVSFFLNLGSPIKKQPELDKVYESEEENDTSPRKGVPPTSYQDMSLESKVPEIKKRPAISFPPIKGYTNRLPAGQMKELLEKKLRRASIARDRLLDERKESLRRYAESIRMKQLILDSRQRLDKLRLEAQLEYNMSSATLNRQIIIRKKRDFFARKVEHSKRVMLLQKMKSFMELRRAISESFVDLIKQDNDPNFPSEFETRVPNPFGLKLQIEQPSSSSDAESEGTVTKDRDLRNMTNAMENTFLFEESPTMTRKETLSAAIRRTKSVPQFVLRSSGSTDTTFLELLNLLPPITRFTLRELDMNEILGNAQLRHDLVFDPDLQFRASEEDDDESKKANSYWDEIRAEVADGQLYRIPLLLAEVRAILVELLPNGQETKKEIFSNIDVNLIDQEISHGIMDPTNLILYLSNSMKTNCAPIRDVLVDEMVSKCKEGDITSTLKLCFEILEYMKLDYANHQLTKLRPFILENAVSYEWKTFKRDFEHKKVGLNNTKNWLNTAWTNYQKTATGSPNPTFDLFPLAFLELMGLAPKFNDESIVPETWTMDVQRIVTFYNSWQDITILGTIMVVFKQAAGPSCTFQELLDAKAKLWILLNDNESTMSHITVQMAESAGTLRGRKFSPQEAKNISTLTENSLSPGSKLYELVQRRVSKHMQDGILGVKLDSELLAKNGLATLGPEIEELTKKLVPVCVLHRAVYGNLYAAALLDIKNGTLKEATEMRKVLKA